MIAHIRSSDLKRQELSLHCRTAARLSGILLRPLGLGATGTLAALLHDMGKATRAFREYLERAVGHPDEKGLSSAPHAPIGAIFAYERWFGEPFDRKLAAQIVSMAVYGHHAGLPDCLDFDGRSPYFSFFNPVEKAKLHYDEAVANYLRAVAGEDELDALFERACAEMRALIARVDRAEAAFQLGMAARLVLGAVVDADRWDSACFERGEEPAADAPGLPDWGALTAAFEAHIRADFTGTSAIDAIRARISRECLACAELPPGVFALTVPTGGGKTFSTLRFALAHAARHGMRRVFYIIPFNTILDQNARDIRRVLDDYEGILEHHSGVVRESEEDEAEYKRLTERWDSDIILTSMVQFLNALFRAENSDARRMHALRGSVLIFDEVQALPKRCTRLFERAARFLVKFLGCTVVLCTATQPQFALQSREMIGDVAGLFADMKRVRYVDQSRAPRDNARAAADLARLMRAAGSVLAVVNTKAAAQEIYRAVQAELGEAAVCRHLSTLMCPAHRLDVLDEVKARAGKGARLPTFLISTALIEAGINLSFPVVVRSLAGLSSIIQAGGRCNRNCEEELGTVYLWRLREENLSRLPDIRAGQELSDAFLRHFEEISDRIGDPDVIGLYFRDERSRYEKELSYPYPKWGTDLCEMLSGNAKCILEARSARTGAVDRLAMPQSFRTAGEAFRVIDQATRTILVPYGEGKEIISGLLGKHGIRDEIRLLRGAQRYGVGVFEHTYRKLAERGAIYPIGETGAVALRAEYYDGEIGLKLEPGELPLLDY